MSQGDLFDGPRDTLAEAKATVEAGRDKGVECPCCGQFAKVYKRPLNATMAACLIGLVRAWEILGSDGYVPIRDVRPWRSKSDARVSGGELAKLACWGLVTAKVHEGNEDKRCSGLWRPTTHGVQFVKGECAVQKYAHIYDGDVLEHTGMDWRIEDALGCPFSYADVMRDATEG
jgi:hypothetical protein